jgi:hypothetical protein
MTAQEAERRRSQSERDHAHPDDHRVLSFRQWCELNGIYKHRAAHPRRWHRPGHHAAFAPQDRHHRREQRHVAGVPHARRSVSKAISDIKGDTDK